MKSIRIFFQIVLIIVTMFFVVVFIYTPLNEIQRGGLNYGALCMGILIFKYIEDFILIAREKQTIWGCGEIGRRKNEQL